MKTQLPFPIRRQPNELTCGPTCLHSVYTYYHDEIDLNAVIDQVDMLEDGGTLASNLGLHALERGYQATIYSFNLNIFDPSWFGLGSEELAQKLEAQMTCKSEKPKLVQASHAYLNFLEKGGEIAFVDLTPDLIGGFLSQSVPLICGLSATYLYKSRREIPDTSQFDDVRGYPSGHFVVLTGIDLQKQTVTISDPYLPNPYSDSQIYDVNMLHLIGAILLGVVTYDANLLVLRKKD